MVLPRWPPPPISSMTSLLTYGPNTLLNNTKMYLIRGKKYVMMGRSDAGKTTHVRVIANKLRGGLLDSNPVGNVFVNTMAVQQGTM